MHIIIDAGSFRRDINVPFSIYGRQADFIRIRDACNKAIENGVDPGWAHVTGEITAPDTVVFPYDKVADEKPVYPWAPKEVK